MDPQNNPMPANPNPAPAAPEPSVPPATPMPGSEPVPPSPAPGPAPTPGMPADPAMMSASPAPVESKKGLPVPLLVVAAVVLIGVILALVLL